MKSTPIKSLAIAACLVALVGCFQKPLPPSQWNDSMSAADDTCYGHIGMAKEGYVAVLPNGGLCSTKVVKEVKNYKYKLSSANKMREVISAAALKAYWYVAIQGPGALTLTYWGNDSKQVIYNVDYTADGYTLTYEDSASMHYDEETGDIHPIYDLWFHGGGQYGLYGLVPTLDSYVYKEYLKERKHTKGFLDTTGSAGSNGGGGRSGGSGGH